MSAVAEEGVTAEQEAQELADRADNIKIAVEAAEGERQRRMSEGNMADVQADLVKQSNIEAAKKAADEEQAARVAEAAKTTVMNEVSRAASVQAAKSALDGAQVEQVFEEVMKQKSGTRWMVCKLGKNKKSLTNEGSGQGWEEFCAAFKSDSVMWGCFAVHGVDERRSVVSVRTKPISVTWVGESVSAMKRMQALQGKSIFSNVVGGAVAVNINATCQDDLNMKDIAIKIADCGGAHKPSHYDFGGTKLSLADIGKAVAGDKF